jgi:hypothetical protein
VVRCDRGEVVSMADDVPDVQRWTAKRRAALVVTILKGESSVAEAARQHGLKVAEGEESASITRKALSVPKIDRRVRRVDADVNLDRLTICPSLANEGKPLEP